MAATSTQPYPLLWTWAYHRQAVWPNEPDTEIIKLLALKHLASELPGTLDLDRLEVHFFSQGDFDKLYSISCSGHSTGYLLRTVLPIVPYYKVESEAAVLSYLKENTSIPTARVIAWNSSAATDLGFEWILLEEIQGVALYDIWRKVPLKSKLEIVATLAPLIGQLRDHKFDRIGSLYFKGRESQPGPENRFYQYERRPSEVTVAEPSSVVAEEHRSPSKLGKRTLSTLLAKIGLHSQPEAESEQSRYIVGQLLDPLLFLHRRLYLPGNRGPFKNEHEWKVAEIDFQLTWMRTGPLIKTLANWRDFDEEDWKSYYDEEVPEIEQLCKTLRLLLPKVYRTAEPDSPCILDLSFVNILVDPDTYAITGIADWDTVNVFPEWQSSRFPRVFRADTPIEELQGDLPWIPTHDRVPDAVVEARHRWDNAFLRQRYDELWNWPQGESASDSARIKRGFEEQILGLTGGAGKARERLRQYLEVEAYGLNRRR